MDKIRAVQITAKALKTRKSFLSAEPHIPICPYSLCEAMGLDLRFVKIPSFEGMYIANQNLVLISAERPEGRKRFTCAHELGHHVLGHGTIIDEILESGSNSKEEQEADFFASMLLMPSSAVTRILKRYGVEAENLTASNCYTISKYFGVSYQAFVVHIYNNLHIIPYKHYQTLKAAKLHEIRLLLSGKNTKNQVFDIGKWWDEKAIELEIGDIIVSKSEISMDGPQILKFLCKDEKCIYTATKPGISRIFFDDWSCFIKVCRHKFQGFYQYKYDEEEE